jgi:phosphopantothenoylcysteine decarboxylase/phosphopantothenate--cysteine ligase
MVKNIDIAYEFGKVKSGNQTSVGFTIETNDEVKHTANKLTKKNFDMLVLNSMNDEQAGTNKVSIIKNDLTKTDYPVKDRSTVAGDIVNEVAGILLLKNNYDDALVSMTA